MARQSLGHATAEHAGSGRSGRRDRVPSLKIVFATCEGRPDITDDDGRLVEAFAQRGISVSALPWTHLSPAAATPPIVLRSTWDYHLQPARFRAWLDQLTRNGTPVFNPIPLVSWNMDKVYLRALAVAGVALPDTIWLAASTGDDADHEAAQVHDAQDLMALLKRQRWTRAVVKPRISASAHGTRRIDPNTRLSPSDLATIASVGGLLQEYLPEIESAGELSLVFLDGAFSHAVRKTPRSGDFRVQQEFGGDVAGAEPSAAAQALAERSLATLREDWCYARIDLVESARGPVLMELELIEPDLFFRIDPAAADRLAESITKRLRR